MDFDKVIVYVDYNEKLQKLTGKKSESIALQESMFFEEFLLLFFELYPDVFKKAVPGTLWHKINGIPTEQDQLIKNGDYVSLALVDIRKVRNMIKNEFDEFFRDYEFKLTSSEIIEEIYFAGEGEMMNFMSKYVNMGEKIKDPDDSEYWGNLLLRAWNIFPHKSLKGKAPAQVLHSRLLKSFNKESKNSKQSDVL